ncbi:MAG: rhodanese-like domain-containing protein [Pseudomonadota bacterium]
MIVRLFAVLAAALMLAGPAAAAPAGWSKLMTPEAVAALSSGPASSGAASSGAASSGAGQSADVRIVDIRSAEDYAAGHIQGAVNVPYGAWRGPKDNPGALISDAAVTELLQGAGIGRETSVIVVNGGEDVTAFGATARVYWTLKSAGLTQLAILNGGYTAWAEAGLPLSTEAPSVMRTDESFSLADTWAIDRDAVRRVVDGESEALLIDARPDTFFRGEKKHAAASWAGTLAGAVNIVHETFFGAEGTMRPDPEAVLASVRAAGYTPGTTVVSFCNTGHWAASNWFALSEVAGIEGVKLYPESMAGWTRAFAPEG